MYFSYPIGLVIRWSCISKAYTLKCCLQEGLRLSQVQERLILQARRDLIEGLQEVAEERKAILAAVAMLLVQRSPVSLLLSVPDLLALRT